MTQLFDPLFTLNSSFQCVAKLLNREIVSQYDGNMPWTKAIDLKYYKKLCKLVTFYFKIQFLHIPQYLLCKNLSIDKMSNTVLTFSDRSRQFSTSAIYLVSYNAEGPQFSVNLASTLCKLAEMSKSKGEDFNLNTVQNGKHMGYSWQRAGPAPWPIYLKNQGYL